MLERLHKILARAGVAALRPAEDMILQGRVAVNGRVVRELGARADPDTDTITVDGDPITIPQVSDPRHYMMVHKPVGTISTAQDTHDRPTVIDMVPGDARVFPVGRLDADSEGLLLLTDDGDLAYRLTHPRFEVDKEYRVLVDHAPQLPELRRWRLGVPLEDGFRTAPAWVEVMERTDDGTWLRVVMREGRKRQIREVARILGMRVLRLIRVREGPLMLGDLPAGGWRPLTQAEIDALRAHTQHVPSREADEERERTMSDEEGGRRRRLRVVRRPMRGEGGRGSDTSAFEPEGENEETPSGAYARSSAAEAPQHTADTGPDDEQGAPPAGPRQRGRFDNEWSPPQSDNRPRSSQPNRDEFARRNTASSDRGGARDNTGGRGFGRQERDQGNERRPAREWSGPDAGRSDQPRRDSGGQRPNPGNTRDRGGPGGYNTNRGPGGYSNNRDRSGPGGYSNRDRSGPGGSSNRGPGGYSNRDRSGPGGYSNRRDQGGQGGYGTGDRDRGGSTRYGSRQNSGPGGHSGNRDRSSSSLRSGLGGRDRYSSGGSGGSGGIRSGNGRFGGGNRERSGPGGYTNRDRSPSSRYGTGGRDRSGPSGYGNTRDRQPGGPRNDDANMPNGNIREDRRPPRPSNDAGRSRGPTDRGFGRAPRSDGPSRGFGPRGPRSSNPGNDYRGGRDTGRGFGRQPDPNAQRSYESERSPQRNFSSGDRRPDRSGPGNERRFGGAPGPRSQNRAPQRARPPRMDRPQSDDAPRRRDDDE